MEKSNPQNMHAFKKQLQKLFFVISTDVQT